jgi:hypothetical protein
LTSAAETKSWICPAAWDPIWHPDGHHLRSPVPRATSMHWIDVTSGKPAAPVVTDGDDSPTEFTPTARR